MVCDDPLYSPDLLKLLECYLKISGHASQVSLLIIIALVDIFLDILYEIKIKKEEKMEGRKRERERKL